MTTDEFDIDFRKAFDEELERVKDLYEITQTESTRQLIEEAEIAMQTNESIDIYLAFIELQKVK